MCFFFGGSYPFDGLGVNQLGHETQLDLARSIGRKRDNVDAIGMIAWGATGDVLPL